MRVLLTALFFLSVAGGAAASPSQICLQQDKVDGWRVLSDNALVVNDRSGKKFRLTLDGACHDLQFQTRLAFKSFSRSGLACLARNDEVDAALPGYGVPAERCRIKTIEPYTAAMENADQTAEGSYYHHPDTHGEIGAIP